MMVNQTERVSAFLREFSELSNKHQMAIASPSDNMFIYGFKATDLEPLATDLNYRDGRYEVHIKVAP